MIKGKYNYDLLCVPIKTTNGGSFTYTDFLDLNFTNVGKINGRQIDAKVHFNSMPQWANEMLPGREAIITSPYAIWLMSQCGCLRPLQGSAQDIVHLKP